MVDRPDPEGNVYVVESLNDEGQRRTVHRKEILESRALVQDVTPVNKQPVVKDSYADESEGDSSGEDSDEDIIHASRSVRVHTDIPSLGTPTGTDGRLAAGEQGCELPVEEPTEEPGAAAWSRDDHDAPLAEEKLLQVGPVTDKAGSLQSKPPLLPIQEVMTERHLDKKSHFAPGDPVGPQQVNILTLTICQSAPFRR